MVVDSLRRVGPLGREQGKVLEFQRTSQWNVVLLRMEPFGLAQSRGGEGWEGHTTDIQPQYELLINL